ncbi:hypothetical protein AAE478_006827 [Parahypoxylon ruwenzoriense]
MSADDPETASASFLTQWTEPSDVFSVLLILGGDVIQLALAALAGGTPPVTPVAFSFGWVAYAVSAVLSAIGENRLVRCAPEVAVQVINLKSGYGRSNKSWLLARLLKTYDYWIPEEVRVTLREPTHYRHAERGVEDGAGKDPDVEAGRPGYAALCVSVYKWSDPEGPRRSKSGVPARDWVWWSGFVTMVVQLGIAAVPWGLYDDWSVFLVTAGGTILALASGALPQWREEKWHARWQVKDVALTLGNGTKHVIVVLGSKNGLDLEDLAGGLAGDSLLSTRVATFALALLWLVLLVTSTGIGMHTWYLLAVGGLGMLQNLMVAGAPRYPDALGLPIELEKTSISTETGSKTEVEIYAEEKVMWTLMKLDMKRKNFGKALLEEFFPGKLMDWEKKWWDSEDLPERRKLLRDAQQKHYTKHPSKGRD